MTETGLTKTQERVVTVLERMANMIAEESEPDFIEQLSDDIEGFLDDLSSNDAFGTEGQNDPRGDMRNALWCMNRVEGIDE